MKQIKIVKTFFLDVDNQDDDAFLSSYSEFGPKGELLVSIDYMGEDEIESKSVFEYTPEGRIAKEIRYMDEDEIAETHIFERDENGRIQQISIGYADQSSSFKKYSFSADELEIEIVTTDDEGELEEREFKKVDKKGNILEHVLWGAEGELKEKYENEFNEADLLVRRLEYDPKGELKVEYKYTYAEDGLLMRRTGFSKKGSIINDLLYQYDEKGRQLEVFMKNSFLTKYIYDDENHTKVEETYNQSGMLDSRIVSTFDEEGHVLTEEKVHHTLRYEYEFYE